MTLKDSKPHAHPSVCITDVIRHVEEFPSPPSIASQVLELALQEGVGIDRIAEVIKSDQSLTLKILKLANSSFYGFSREIKSVDQAAVILGLSALKNVLFGVVVRESLLQGQVSEDEPLKLIWQHSLATAAGAQLLAERKFPHLAGAAFAAGMIHDCGKILMLTAFTGRFEAVMEKASVSGNGNAGDLESRVFGVDHATAGRRLVEKWGLPEALVEVVWLHHQPIEALEDVARHRELVLLVGLADMLAHEVMLDRNPAAESAVVSAAEALGFNRDEIGEIRGQIGKAYQERVAIFDLEKDSSKFYLSALQRAKGRLANFNLELERTNVQLNRTNRSLEALSAAGLDFGTVDDVEELLDRAATALKEGLRVRQGFFFVLDRKEYVLNGRFWDKNGPVFPGRCGLDTGFRPMLKKESCLVPEAFRPWVADFPSRVPPGKNVSGLGMSFRDPYYIIPFFSGGEYMGELQVQPEVSGECPAENDLTVFSQFAHLLAAAVSRLQMRLSLEERAERLGLAMRKMQKINLKLMQTERLAAVGQLAAGAAHEINNPLAIVSARLQLLEMKEADDSRRKHFRLMMGQIDRISSILKGLMDFARPAPPSFRPTDINEVLRKALALVKGGLEKHRLGIKESLTPGLPVIQADGRQLEQVFLNLFINAEHAMEESGGTLKVATAKGLDGKSVEIVVEDSGVGISQEYRDKIFDPFFTTKEEGKGTGLGLSTSYGIVKNHQGDIRIDSEVGRGTRVTVSLPADRDSVHDTGREHLSARAEKNGKGILVVDDEQHIRDILKESLESEGYPVVTATNGQEALLRLAHGQFRLMLLDIRMPQRSGLSLLSQITDLTVNMPVIVLTGLASPEEMEEALTLGAVKCLQKPFQVGELLAEVRDALDRSVQGNP